MSITTDSLNVSISTDYAIPKTPERKRGREEEESPNPQQSKQEINFLNTSISTKRIGLRENTNNQTRESKLKAESAPTPAKGRKIQDISETASLIETDENHDCSVVNIAHTIAKTSNRLLFSLIRIALPYAFGCKTERGKTDINGDSCKCGKCQAAHAALTTKIYDNILEVVGAALLINGLNDLHPTHHGILRKRFNLSELEEQNLSSKNQTIRIETFDALVSKIPPRDRKKSFAGTSAVLVRGATHANPTGCNRLDSHLEGHLRPLEDELAEDCRIDAKTPVEALIVLQDAYRKLLEIAIPHLKKDLKHLSDLHLAWDEMIACQLAFEASKETFENYLTAVDNYLTAHTVRFTKLQGAPSLGSLKEYLKRNQSPRVLKTLQSQRDEDYFQSNNRFLKKPSDSNEIFTESAAEVQRRLIEAETQLTVVDHSVEEIKAMLKYLFGKKDENGVVKTPSKETIAEGFIELMPRVSDSNKENERRSSIKRDITGDFLRQ